MHTSIKLNKPIEVVNVVPLNPLISKCQIKVCYVGDQPNRNNTVITKEVALQMANSLPGSPIVGFYDNEVQDFKGHERELVIDESSVYFKDITRPYGFVDLHANVWFEKFSDDGIEHEYLMTEGYLWTEQYPEAKRIIEKGNNQSMELDENLTTGQWARENNENKEFFIINEAIISKLCILGEDVEPCFEGASIANLKFSFDDKFKYDLSLLMEKITEILERGEVSMETMQNDTLEEVVEEIEETVTPTEAEVEEVVETEELVEETIESEETVQEEPVMSYNLEEISEYVELSHKYSSLQDEYNTLVNQVENLTAELATLTQEATELRTFKLGVERKDKEAMIARFYMLSDEEKANVINNIDNYSVLDIEKELSVICVRNKVNFNLEEDNNQSQPLVFNLNSVGQEDSVPAWIQAVRNVAKKSK